ncbi:ATP-NAD kinase-like domain-containing protein [Gloeopeniophorella convolvens]|nr:ATP-NAD kinase-like domain-containing protein [Gloeopeniophorella convolvens]
MPLLVVYNPAAGARTGARLTHDTVLPLLAAHGLPPDLVVATERPQHSGELVLAALARLAPAEPLTLVLVSGDGTLHEIANALHDARSAAPLRVALVPGGTANALHASLFPPPADALAAVRALVTGAAAVPLALAHTRVLPPGADPAPEPTASVLSAVVTSTALHASILHDSEALRASVPGIERFKLAAAQNATTWYRARVRLLGSSASRYDPASDAFVPLAGEGEGERELAGPFAYFLAAINVDRLEPAFRIAPLQRSHPPAPGARTTDVLAVRPLRDPALGGRADEDARGAFKERLWGVLGGAYEDGAHVRARYAPREGEAVGAPVVEYFRVEGWEWIPEEDDDKAHLLCADGTIFHVPKGGKVVSAVLGQADHVPDISIYA